MGFASAECGDSSFQPHERSGGDCSSDQLQVFRRRRWVDPDGQRTAIRLATLLAEGRCEQMEKVANYFREQKVVRGNQTGEFIYGLMADMVAERGDSWRSSLLRPRS